MNSLGKDFGSSLFIKGTIALPLAFPFLFCPCLSSGKGKDEKKGFDGKGWLKKTKVEAGWLERRVCKGLAILGRRSGE